MTEYILGVVSGGLIGFIGVVIGASIQTAAKK